MFKKWMGWLGGKQTAWLAYHDVLSNKAVTFDLEQDRVQIGRATENDLRLLDPNSHVSRQHAVIFFENDRWFIQDLNSLYGVYVNGEKIKDIHRLRSGDVIHLATIEMTFHAPSSAVKPRPSEPIKAPLVLDDDAVTNIRHETLPMPRLTLTKEEAPPRTTLVKDDEITLPMSTLKEEPPRTTLVKPTEDVHQTLVKDEDNE